MKRTPYNRLKKWIFGILLLGISVPLIQHITGFSNVKGLSGAVQNEAASELSVSSWFHGDYQKQTDLYLNDQFGFRPSFVRFHNQIQFSCFNIPHAKGIVIGKEWYLFEKNYIDAYYGKDFIGDSIILENTKRLKFMQEDLKARGKSVVLLLAPSKGTYFPEFFPDSLKSKKSRTNYEAYIENLANQNVNYLDFNKWFLEMKSRTKYPLYPKGGIHWSKYGEILALDSMVKFIEKSSEKRFPKLKIDEFVLSAQNKESDYDIGEAMNLLFQIPTEPMAYPKYHIEQPELNTNKVLFVSDSYFWGLYYDGFTHSLFGNGQFWYYNNEIYEDKLTLNGHVSDKPLLHQLEKFDVIVIISTDANLTNLSSGFINQYFEARKE